MCHQKQENFSKARVLRFHFSTFICFRDNNSICSIKALANEDTLLQTLLLLTQMFSRFARARNICCGHKFCVWEPKNVSETFCVRNKCFLVCATWKHNIHFVVPNKLHEQECVCINVPSFTSALRPLIISCSSIFMAQFVAVWLEIMSLCS